MFITEMHDEDGMKKFLVHSHCYITNGHFVGCSAANESISIICTRVCNRDVTPILTYIM